MMSPTTLLMLMESLINIYDRFIEVQPFGAVSILIGTAKFPALPGISISCYLSFKDRIHVLSNRAMPALICQGFHPM